MKYLLAILILLYLATALMVSEMLLIRYIVRCEMRRFVHVICYARS